MNTQKPTVVVAGARGFVGQAILPRLKTCFDVVGLSRGANADAEGVAWRQADLFSRKETHEALRGADLAVYLVHSMLPSARLTQGKFEDMDLICADNFARAARDHGVRQIVYLGGLVPEGRERSRHLESRLEVERALSAYGTPVTVLRAGLVVGPGGSSTSMVTRLVRRLPVMACPSWTRTETQPVALRDVAAIVESVLDDAASFDRIYDLGGPERMTYQELMQRTAGLMGVTRPMLDVPFPSPGLSTLWVSAITGAPPALVGPLVESLRHRMVAGDEHLEAPSPTTFDEAMRDALSHEDARSEAPRAFRRQKRTKEKKVRSVQRLPLPEGRDARWVAEEYARWLPKFMWPLIRVETRDGGSLDFFARGVPAPLLRLEFSSVSEPERQLFWIRGGLLARDNDLGRLEFREALGGECVLAAIHDFEPRLPWYVYRYTQAVVHLWVMHGFSHHLAAHQKSRGLFGGAVERGF